jgi:hypothetical protein
MGMNVANCHCKHLREGAASKKIHESEDLLGQTDVFSRSKKHFLI